MEKCFNENDMLKGVAEIDDSDVQLINQYTTRSFDKDELYVFKLVLCDNDIDRDNEAFSVEALEDMGKLFVGRTGIADHNPSAENQSARIFSCQTQKIEEKKTAYGEDYVRLTAKAYIPINSNTEKLIQLIESGIKKEVSVGCRADSVVCSICGKDVRKESCSHIKGREYDGKICYHILSGISDAYEWSFVAVPSQREAGVIKDYRYVRREDKENFLEQLRNGNYKSVNADNIGVLMDYIKELEEYAGYGRAYEEELRKDYIRYGSMCFNSENNGEGCFEVLSNTAKKLSLSELERMVALYRGKVEENIFLAPQLISDKEVLSSSYEDDRHYNI